jgi:DNA repair exonuclease SbcCD nuclease subunit
LNKKVYFLGDLHGHFDLLTSQLKKSQFNDAHIIQVGDFGVGFNRGEESRQLTILNEVCEAGNIKLYVIRGNHDDPSYFNGLFTEYNNILFVKDNTFLQLNGLTYFFSGGAISIDRCIRKVGINYWANEGVDINFNSLESDLLKYPKIDVVVTHSSPSFAFPTQYDRIVHAYIRRDSSLDKELRDERALITKLYDLLLSKKIHHWIYGHFHAQHEETTHTGVHFVALDINEFYEIPLRG